jgi:hypothetical protein
VPPRVGIAFRSFQVFASRIHEAIDRKMWNERLDFISTVGQLHEALERCFGEAGWQALTGIWCETNGIVQPTRSSIDITNRIPEQNQTHGLPLTPSPSRASSLDLESEAKALRELPRGIRKFWLHEPPLRAWRYSETSEKELREDRESDGAWAGW